MYVVTPYLDKPNRGRVEFNSQPLIGTFRCDQVEKRTAKKYDKDFLVQIPILFFS